MKWVRWSKLRVVGVATLGALLIVALAFFFIHRIQNSVASLNLGEQLNMLTEPVLRNEELVGNISQPVAITFLNPEVMVYGDKTGRLTAYVLSNGTSWSLGTLPEINVSGDGGLQSLTVDREFFDNRYIYACYSAFSPDRGNEIRVSRFEVGSDFRTIDNRLDIVTGIPSISSRNQGCAIEMDRLANIWIAVGDTGSPTVAQDPKSTGGKVLRVLRDGNPSSGNQPLPFDPRIFSYGHRDPQGITLLEAPLLNGSYGYISERGGVQDDEINQLKAGNFGWDPNVRGVYTDDSPMTDQKKFSNSIRALWSSGRPVPNVGDIERLGRKRWQAWQNQLLVAAKKPEATRLLELAKDGSLKSEKIVFQELGPLDTVTEGPDGNLYIGTARGDGTDKIIRVSVVCTVCD